MTKVNQILTGATFFVHPCIFILKWALRSCSLVAIVPRLKGGLETERTLVQTLSCLRFQNEYEKVKLHFLSSNFGLKSNFGLQNALPLRGCVIL